MTKLTIPISEDSLPKILAQITNADNQKAQQLEIRLDQIPNIKDFTKDDFASIVNQTTLPIIWTLRHTSEGGKFEGDVQAQIKILATAIATGGHYIDIEFARWESAFDQQILLQTIENCRSQNRDVKLILSAHNFEITPDDLADRFKKIENHPSADIPKIATTPSTINDNFKTFDLIKNCKKSPIAISMTELGEISRILAPKLKANLTFASLSNEQSSAPGQLTLTSMLSDYNYNNITPNTLIAGVVAHPVHHSLSPLIHNKAYQAMSQDALYIKFDVANSYEEFSDFIDNIRSRPWLDIMGLSITIPHKTNALKYLKANKQTIDPLAEKIGAVNTITFHPDGSLIGHNTDYLGVLKTLEQEADLPIEKLADKKVAVLGAGGVSRAIVAAMTKAKADITIYNRTEKTAQALAAEFNCKSKPWADRNELSADIIINATSLGLTPNIDQSPLEAHAIKADMIVFDTVYNPLKTKLLLQAINQNAIPITGDNMLVYQAAEQIKLWLLARQTRDISPPIDIMKQAMQKKLKLKS